MIIFALFYKESLLDIQATFERLVKQRKPTAKMIRRCMQQQFEYPRRNLGFIHNLVTATGFENELTHIYQDNNY